MPYNNYRLLWTSFSSKRCFIFFTCISVITRGVQLKIIEKCKNHNNCMQLWLRFSMSNTDSFPCDKIQALKASLIRDDSAKNIVIAKIFSRLSCWSFLNISLVAFNTLSFDRHILQPLPHAINSDILKFAVPYIGPEPLTLYLHAEIEWWNWPGKSGCTTRKGKNLLDPIPSIVFESVSLPRVPLCTAEKAFQGTFINSIWTPNGCNIHSSILGNFTYDSSAQAARNAVLSKTHLLVVGDSTLQIFMKVMVDLLGGPDLYQPKNLKKKLMKLQRFCRASNWAKMRYSDFIFDNGVRLSFLFNGNKNPCNNMGGVTSHNFPWAGSQFKIHFERMLRAAFKNCQRLVLMFNSGLHDFGSTNFSFLNYNASLDSAFRYMKNYIRKLKVNYPLCSRPALFFVNTQPKTKSFSCRGVNNNLPLGNPGVQVMNKIAETIARSHRFRILDIYSLRVNRPADGDGHHCHLEGRNFRPKGGGKITDSPSCLAGAMAFLHAASVK